MDKIRKKELKDYASWFCLYGPEFSDAIEVADYVARKWNDELTIEESVFVYDLLTF